MQITIKLYANLGEYLPVGAQRNVARLEVPQTATVCEVIEQLGLPAEQVHLVLVNGIYVTPEARAVTVLSADDALAVWPPVAGG